MTPLSLCTLPVTRDQAGAEHDRAEALEDLRPDDDVGDVGLVLQRHEDDAAGAVPGRWRMRTRPATVTRRPFGVSRSGLRCDDAARRRGRCAQERQRVRLQRQLR